MKRACMTHPARMRLTKVCLHCGSPNLVTASLERGGIPGAFELSGIYRCEKCGYVGVPLLVKDAAKYRKHASCLKKQKR
ncbi:hypothetical protein COT29_02690 [Candidatus Micrarchaeota archaeon CG08_land_8_20_14_0_20_59_11]|nr:MAG: hypothetical protein COT29_02690 [Candidatus Micrarchaeota archaeon CG08_land_8_20_14_0_20_59_11]